MELIETKIGEYDLLTETKNDDKIKILNEERDTVKTGIQFKNTENKLIDNTKCIVSKIQVNLAMNLRTLIRIRKR